MSDLEKAMEMLMERKMVIIEKVEHDLGDEVSFGAGVKDSEARALFLGTDIDSDEAAELGSKIATIAILGIVSGQVSSADALTGVWIDGLMTGCILKDLIAKKDRIDDQR